MIWISCHVVAPMQPSAGEGLPRNLPPYTHIDYETRVPIFEPRRRVSVGQNAKTLPAHPNGTRPHRTRDAAANRALLREETTPSTCPPKNGLPCSSGARHASFRLPRHARREPRDCSTGRGSHDPRATHPQPAPGRGRRRNASNTARQRRRRRPDTKKRRRGARQSDPTSEACVTRRPFRASQRRRSGGV